VHWKGKAETNYPWGKETDYESLVSTSTTPIRDQRGLWRSGEHLRVKRSRTQMAGTFVRGTDQKNFYYKYTRELLKDSQMVKEKTWQETIPRDHQ